MLPFQVLNPLKVQLFNFQEWMQLALLQLDQLLRLVLQLVNRELRGGI